MSFLSGTINIKKILILSLIIQLCIFLFICLNYGNVKKLSQEFDAWGDVDEFPNFFCERIITDDEIKYLERKNYENNFQKYLYKDCFDLIKANTPEFEKLKKLKCINFNFTHQKSKVKKL